MHLRSQKTLGATRSQALWKNSKNFMNSVFEIGSGNFRLTQEWRFIIFRTLNSLFRGVLCGKILFRARFLRPGVIWVFPQKKIVPYSATVYILSDSTCIWYSTSTHRLTSSDRIIHCSSNLLLVCQPLPVQLLLLRERERGRALYTATTPFHIFSQSDLSDLPGTYSTSQTCISVQYEYLFDETRK